MKALYTLLFLAGLLTSCQNTNQENKSDSKPETQAAITTIKTIQLDVQGMTCEGCENTIETNLVNLDGVISAEALHTKGTAVISFDSTKLDNKKISQVINKLGYHVVE